MDKDSLNNIFEGYHPPLGQSSMSFLSHLNDKLDAVEMIKTRADSRRRRNRIAQVVAALTGAVTGSILTLFIDRIMALLLQFTALAQSLVPSLHINIEPHLLSIIIISMCVVMTALGAYNLTKSLAPYRLK